MGLPPAKVYQEALHKAGIPLTAFAVQDVQKEYERMSKLGVMFRGKPAQMGPTTMAVLDDTCGNLIQIFQPSQPDNTAEGSARSAKAPAIKIKLSSVMVTDQEKALKFYTEVLGFVKKRDMPAGEARWLTVVSPKELDGPELLLEPMDFPPARTFQQALYKAGIPLTAFAVEDVQKEYGRLTKLGVVFSGKPAKMGPTTMAVFDDTCGNLIQIFQK
jgi:predicted enzyme related to lactoylglutathione lyase